jgi:hypothetical protein
MQEGSLGGWLHSIVSSGKVPFRSITSNKVLGFKLSKTGRYSSRIFRLLASRHKSNQSQAGKHQGKGFRFGD